MTRPIKFRAWDPKENKMIFDITLRELIINYCDEFNYPARLNEGLSQNLIDKGAIFMQFTGLHDKNGKEICEGDVVAFRQLSGDSIVTEIFYNENRAMFTTKENIYLANGAGEVLGNIYENPELLESK